MPTANTDEALTAPALLAHRTHAHCKGRRGSHGARPACPRDASPLQRQTRLSRCPPRLRCHHGHSVLHSGRGLPSRPHAPSEGHVGSHSHPIRDNLPSVPLATEVSLWMARGLIHSQRYFVPASPLQRASGDMGQSSKGSGSSGSDVPSREGMEQTVSRCPLKMRVLASVCRMDGVLLSEGCVLAQSRLTLCDPADCNPPGFSVHGILHARILGWGAIPREGSVQFSLSVMSYSLRLHESQYATPPCPSPTPRVHSDSRPSSQ